MSSKQKLCIHQYNYQYRVQINEKLQNIRFTLPVVSQAHTGVETGKRDYPTITILQDKVFLYII